jgi:type IV pilus assembly protein PilQ
LPPRGDAKVDERTNTILIRDLPEKIELARELVARLDTPTPQVLIEARIVEVSSTYSEDLGVQWGGSFTADAAHGNAPGYSFPNSVGLKGDTGLSNYAVNLPVTAGSAGSAGAALALSLGSINDVIGLDLRIAALETAGKGRVVSSPRVTTLDNKAAEISQGIEIPFTTATNEKIETQSIDYLLKLMVTPHVTSDNSVMLRIDLKKDAPSTTFFSVDSSTPAKETRTATTEVLVRDGETTVIGGIITDTTSEKKSGVPWFHKIPFIGWMFQNTSNRVDKTELIIFITPKIIRVAETARSL